MRVVVPYCYDLVRVACEKGRVGAMIEALLLSREALCHYTVIAEQQWQWALVVSRMWESRRYGAFTA